GKRGSYNTPFRWTSGTARWWFVVRTRSVFSFGREGRRESFDHLRKFPLQVGLADEPVNAEYLCKRLVGPLFVDRHEDYLDVGRRFFDLPGGLEAAHDWHADIHQDEVGVQRPGLENGITAVIRFADDLDSIPHFQIVGHFFSEPLVVVCNQYSQKPH